MSKNCFNWLKKPTLRYFCIRVDQGCLDQMSFFPIVQFRVVQRFLLNFKLFSRTKTISILKMSVLEFSLYKKALFLAWKFLAIDVVCASHSVLLFLSVVLEVWKNWNFIFTWNLMNHSKRYNLLKSCCWW